MAVAGITIAPTAARHTHTVVFLHGRGDNVQNFVAALSTWRGSSSSSSSANGGGGNLFDAFPSVRWVFPQAPVRKLASDPNNTSWPQWFDVWDTRDFGLREEVQLEGLREMVPAVGRLLAAEAEVLGGRWDRVVLAGISMGGATAAHTLFNLDVPESGGGRLAGFMGFSARCPFAGRELGQMREVLGVLRGVVVTGGGDGVLRGTPVLLEHCVDDPLVKIENGRGLRDTLRGFGAGVEWKEYPEGGHWFHSPDGMDDVVEFLNRHVLGKDGAGVVGERQGHAGDDMDVS